MSSKVIDGKYQSYAKGPLIFTTEFLLSHFGGPAFSLPQIMSAVLLISIVLEMQHNVLANKFAKQLLLPLFETAPPEWEQKIQDTYLSIYNSLFWECKASGKPDPWYTWLKNGERLNLDVSSYGDVKLPPTLLGKFYH